MNSFRIAEMQLKKRDRGAIVEHQRKTAAACGKQRIVARKGAKRQKNEAVFGLFGGYFRRFLFLGTRFSKNLASAGPLAVPVPQF